MPTATECRENVGESSAGEQSLWFPGFKIFRFSRHSVAAGTGPHDQPARAALAWSRKARVGAH
jgi:hypothetical protein